MKENSIEELIQMVINRYIENNILNLDLSDSTKNRLKRDLRKKFLDKDFIYDIKNNIGLIPKSKVKEILDKNCVTFFEGDSDFPDDASRIIAKKYIKAEVLQDLLRKE